MTSPDDLADADEIVLHAAERLTTDDVDVLFALPSAWHRLAVAGALRPWPAHAIDTAVAHGRVAGWADADVDALGRVMADAYPRLTRPEGIDDDRRWWMIADVPYDVTVWRADDGTLAIEVLDDGPAMSCTTRLLDDAAAAAFRNGGIAALRPLVDEIRRR